MQNIKSLHSGELSLYLITAENFAQVRAMFENEPESDELVEELEESYQPKFDSENRLTFYGFYIIKAGRLAGLTLLQVDSWRDARGSTGADVLPGWRGQGIAPASKPPLFYLGFGLLGLNRIETGHIVSNIASQRSIEKTPGFRLEGLLREYERNDEGEFEDTLYYGILKRDWLDLYKDITVEVVYDSIENSG
jgi:ribosomal-protein-serine acetyltransferase